MTSLPLNLLFSSLWCFLRHSSLVSTGFKSTCSFWSPPVCFTIIFFPLNFPISLFQRARLCQWATRDNSSFLFSHLKKLHSIQGVFRSCSVRACCVSVCQLVRYYPLNTVVVFIYLFICKKPPFISALILVFHYELLFPSSVQCSDGRPMAQRPQSPSQQRPNSSPNPVSSRETCRSSWRAAPTRSYWEPSSTRYAQRRFPSSGGFFYVFGNALSVSERQHNGAPAEGRLCPLRRLVHGCVHAGRREAASCRTVREQNVLLV